MMDLNYRAVYELADSDSISEALGLTDERMEELTKIVKSSANECNRITETLVDLWNKCNHPNEYAWCVFMYGTNLGVHKTINEFSGLKDLLK